MKNSSVYAVLVSLVLSFSNTYSQGIFLEKGEAGFYFGGGYTSLEKGDAVSLGGGFALGGIMELGFTSTNTSVDNPYSSEDIEVNSKTVSVGAVLIKKKAQLTLNIGYSTIQGGSDVLLLGFNVGSEIKLHQSLSWYPIFSFAVGIPTAEDGGNPVTALGVTAPILIAEHAYLGPTFAISDGNFSWGVSAGIIISFNTATAGGW